VLATPMFKDANLIRFSLQEKMRLELVVTFYPSLFEESSFIPLQ
jgi:hypothetical protein